eukprot:293739-Prorocentrum_minimum.AAC.1
MLSTLTRLAPTHCGALGLQHGYRRHERFRSAPSPRPGWPCPDACPACPAWPTPRAPSDCGSLAAGPGSGQVWLPPPPEGRSGGGQEGVRRGSRLAAAA